jgi:hypothetical protein
MVVASLEGGASKLAYAVVVRLKNAEIECNLLLISLCLCDGKVHHLKKPIFKCRLITRLTD